LLTSRWLRKRRRDWFWCKGLIYPEINKIHFYFRLNDPYCFLLLQALPELLKTDNNGQPLTDEEIREKVNVEILLWLPAELNVEKDKQAYYALSDAKILAQDYGLFFPSTTKLPEEQLTIKATRILLANKNTCHLFSLCNQLAEALWQNDSKLVARLEQSFGHLGEPSSSSMLQKTVVKLQKSGHYQSGMLHYAGEWYWGIDRLWHLWNRLNRQEKTVGNFERSFKPYLSRHPKLLGRNSNDVQIKQEIKANECIDFYFSFRSPYSYLAVERIFAIAKRYTLKVNIKPVLPMVMRGLMVPKIKRLYIVHDAKREAERYQVPFGKISDPLGGGVEKCMALFFYAQRQGKEQAFVAKFSAAIWSKGANTRTIHVLQRLSQSIGLNWQQAKDLLTDESWQKQAEVNRRQLNELGLWGVPCFVYKGQTFWGQDRIIHLEKRIQSNHYQPSFCKNEK